MAAGSTLIATSRPSSGVGRAIDLSHPAGADRGGDAVLGEATADHGGIPRSSSTADSRPWMSKCDRGADSTAGTSAEAFQDRDSCSLTTLPVLRVKSFTSSTIF